ncbi:hypothetical protein GTR02_05715 [Kineococcus sp. R8]|uniref:hypothetical protein n=1 Tax=Kineococcus siccus TaxID=2696567 RepID=UPI00141230C6|nr:hypothetical protein [Kineococcus siccus]NAZ81308.1 hypothetical protein [Kineococcus siccus]
MRAVLRFAAKALVGLLLLQGVFLGLLVAAQAVPNGPIIDTLAAAVRSGDYGAPYAPDGVGGTADRFTECVVVGYGVTSPDDPRSVWYRATGAPRLSACEQGRAEIELLAAGGSLVPPAGYFRYWSGYSVLTRPLLAVTDVASLRLVVSGLFGAACLGAGVALARRAGTPAAFALLVPVAAATNAIAMPSAAFSHGISLAALAAGVALTAVTARTGWRGAALGAGGAAALFCYVDLLTVPPMSWALCAAVAGAVAHRARPGVLPTLRVVLAAGVAWPAAFGITWVSRWVIAALVQGPGVFRRVAEVGEYRLDGGGVSQEFGAAIGANWTWWVQHTVTAVPLLVAAAVVVVVGLVLAARRSGAQGLLVAAVLAAPALVVPAWYVVLSNHSQVHAFFTYRSIPAAVGVVAMAAVVAASGPLRPAPELSMGGGARPLGRRPASR